MKELIKKLWGKYRIYIIMGLILVLGLLLMVQTCRVKRVYHDLSLSKGRVSAVEDLLVEQKEETKEAERQANDKIAELDSHIDSLVTIVSAKDGEMESLTEAFNDLEAVEGAITGKDELISNLRAQKGTLVRQLDLARSIIVAKDGVIFDLKTKYDEQVKISTALRDEIVIHGEYNNEKNLLIRDLERALGKRKASANLNKWVSRGLALALGLSLLKK